jgi:hypothetical protein
VVSEGSPSGQVIASSVSQPLGSQPFVVTWEKLPTDYGLPDDPVENVQQPILAAALTDALGATGFIQPEMLLASNFGSVATVNQKTVVKAPDGYMCRVSFPCRKA